MLDPKHPLAELLRRDTRYKFDAYVFVFDALRFGQEELGLGRGPGGGDESLIDPLAEAGEGDHDELDSELDEASDAEDDSDDDPAGDDVERHVTGQELCMAIQRYAIDQYGLLARSVLGHWGVHTTGDFGEIVFNLIDIGQMRKTDNDRREDFDDVYDFADAFGREEVFAGAECDPDSSRDDTP